MMFRFASASILATALLAVPAQAGALDKLNEAIDGIKRLSSNLPSSDKSPSVPGDETDASGGDSTVMPLGLLQYPKSRLLNRVTNPMERVRMPVSVPRDHPDDGYVSPYSVPMEGKVSMLQFEHRSDDSPLLIVKHYEAWLAQQGFERLLLCEAPCEAAASWVYWRPVIDASKRMDASDLPSSATYVVGYKRNTMALFGVGESGSKFSSFVKVVEGQVIDASPWQQVTASRNPPPGVTNSNAGQAAQSDTLNGEVELVASDDLPSRIAESKGFVMLHLTSFDPSCPYCTRSNPKIEQLAKRYAGKVATWRATWQPWLSMKDDDYIRAQGITGLPATLTFKNGKLIRRVMGDQPVDKLEKELLAGLK